MLTKSDRAEKLRGIERTLKLRRDNLRRLADMYGSWAELSRRSGLSPQFLVQLGGPNPRRSVSEKTARDLEDKLHLPALWLDQPR